MRTKNKFHSLVWFRAGKHSIPALACWLKPSCPLRFTSSSKLPESSWWKFHLIPRPPAQIKQAPFISDARLVGLPESTTWYWSCEEKEANLRQHCYIIKLSFYLSSSNTQHRASESMSAPTKNAWPHPPQLGLHLSAEIHFIRCNSVAISKKV